MRGVRSDAPVSPDRSPEMLSVLGAIGGRERERVACVRACVHAMSVSVSRIARSAWIVLTRCLLAARVSERVIGKAAQDEISAGDLAVKQSSIYGS